MHEVYIAENLLETAICKCKENGFDLIKSVKIKLGSASVVSTEALIFAFDALKIGSPAENASLIIEEILTSGFCKTCNSNFFVDKDFVFECPVCKSESVMIECGNGIELEEIEVDHAA